MPRPVSCAWCGSRGDHEPGCQVGDEVARIRRRRELLGPDVTEHPSTQRPVSIPEAALRHPPDCTCSWACEYVAAHSDEED